MSSSLDLLLADGVIENVIGQLKTGKEAEVWLVQHAGQVVAAKLYKERHARSFRHNAGYLEGREVRSSRTRRAMAKGTRFGQAAAEDAWKSAEADALYTLHARGVRVPTPVLFYGGVLLMELVLDAEGRPAPRMIDAPPATAEAAHALYLDLRGQVVRMLAADLIHGDLSAYNILMGAAGPTVIDFPQTVAAAHNSRAEHYFRRDLDNVRNFLAGFAPGLRGMAGDTGRIWTAYMRREITPDFVPSSVQREAPRRPGAHAHGNTPGPHAGHSGPRPDRRPRTDSRGAPHSRDAPRVAGPHAGAPGHAGDEAELRALEAQVLRQGGGERAKPAGQSGPHDARRRHPRPGQGRRSPGGGGPSNGGGRPPHAAGPRPGGRPQPTVQYAPAQGVRTQQSSHGGRGSPKGQRTSGKGGHAGAGGQRSARPGGEGTSAEHARPGTRGHPSSGHELEEGDGSRAAKVPHRHS